MKIKEPMFFAGLTHAFVNARQDFIHVRSTLRFGFKATVLDQHLNTWGSWNDWECSYGNAMNGVQMVYCRVSYVLMHMH